MALKRMRLSGAPTVFVRIHKSLTFTMKKRNPGAFPKLHDSITPPLRTARDTVPPYVENRRLRRRLSGLLVVNKPELRGDKAVSIMGDRNSGSSATKSSLTSRLDA